MPAEAADRAALVGDKLPSVDELVARVPANVLGMLDDLFRAKFTGVRRFAAPGTGPAAVTPSSPGPSAGGR